MKTIPGLGPARAKNKEPCPGTVGIGVGKRRLQAGRSAAPPRKRAVVRSNATAPKSFQRVKAKTKDAEQDYPQTPPKTGSITRLDGLEQGGQVFRQWPDTIQSRKPAMPPVGCLRKPFTKTEIPVSS